MISSLVTQKFSRNSAAQVNPKKKRKLAIDSDRASCSVPDFQVDRGNKKEVDGHEICCKKKEVARFRRESGKTGGGPPPTAPEDLHHKIISIVGEEAVDGVVGGIDTAQDLSDHCNAGEGDHAQPGTSDGLHYGEQARPLKKRRYAVAEESVAAEMLKTQQGILASLKELLATQQRSVSVQERLLALEEC